MNLNTHTICKSKRNQNAYHTNSKAVDDSNLQQTAEPTMDAGLPTPFFFRQRTGAFDWDKLDRLSISKVIGDVDLDTLQSLLDSLTFTQLNPSISAPRSSTGDSLAIKGMMVQQLIVEYLLNVQESINQSETTLKQELR